MSYIGKEPQYTDFLSKFFNGDGTAMTVTLDASPPNEAALLVFIDGVRQDTSAYTVSGYSLTFTGVVPSGTNNVQVVHLGIAQDTQVPVDDSVSTAKIQDDAVTSAKLANSLNITSGNSLTIDSGATITNNGTASGFGGNNTPVFRAVGTSDQSASASTWTKVQLDSVDIDTDSGWDSGNYRWTVPTGEGGKYFISGGVRFNMSTGDIQQNIAVIYKNGSAISNSWRNYWFFPSGGISRGAAPTVNGVIELSAGDYIELYALYSGGTATINRADSTHLTIFKMIE